MIPEKSTASLKNGNWLIHREGDDVIQVWTSNLNGKERVFLNGELKSEQLSMRKQNAHVFEDDRGGTYEVAFEVESLMKGNIKCRISRDGEHLKTFTIRYQRGKVFSLKQILFVVGAGLIYGVASAVYNLPEVAFFIFLVVVLVVHIKMRNPGEVIVEEEQIK